MARKKKETNRVDELLDELLGETDGSPEAIWGESGLLKQLSQRLVERALDGELTHHLKQAQEPDSAVSSPKSRKGFSKKTVQSEQGEMELSIPRDRAGEFEPILVPKHQRRLAGLDEKILAMYARGSSNPGHQRSARRALWSQGVSLAHQRGNRCGE